MQPRLQDIARDLGVSSATVSNALTGKGRVSEDLKGRIRAHALSMGYVPNRQGRALRTGRSGVLGLVLPDLTNPLFPALAQAIEAAAAQAGYGVLIADSRGDSGAQTEALRRLVRQGADGIVVVPRRGTRVMAMQVPVALIDTASTPGNSVSADHRQGGRIAIRHLRDLGHRAIAVLGESRASLVQNDRIGGMRSAAEGATLRVLWLEDGAPDLPGLVAQGVTALIATSDLHALTALTALQRAGLSVPGQISVMGFDDLSFSAAVMPGLTSIAQNAPAIAAGAVASLCARIDGAPAPDQTIVPMTLIRRGSTGPAPAPTTRPETPPTERAPSTEEHPP